MSYLLFSLCECLLYSIDLTLSVFVKVFFSDGLLYVITNSENQEDSIGFKQSYAYQ